MKVKSPERTQFGNYVMLSRGAGREVVNLAIKDIHNLLNDAAKNKGLVLVGNPEILFARRWVNYYEYADGRPWYEEYPGDTPWIWEDVRLTKKRVLCIGIKQWAEPNG